MSKENVQMFFKMVETDATLRASYGDFLKGIAETRLDEESAIPEVVKFANQQGVQFSAEDLTAVANEMKNGNLTDEQLKGVAGGGDSGQELAFVLLSGGSLEGDSFGTLCFILGGGVG